MHSLVHFTYVYCPCVQGSGADLLEHEGQYVQYHLLMVWRHLQDGEQAPKVGGATGTNGKMPHNVDTALMPVVNELQAKPLMPSTATACQKAQYRDILECNFPIDALVTQFLAGGILVQLEYEDIRSTPNYMERNRKFFDYLFRKNDAALARTLDILNQPQYHSYHYLGNILKKVFCRQAPHIQSLS